MAILNEQCSRQSSTIIQTSRYSDCPHLSQSPPYRYPFSMRIHKIHKTTAHINCEIQKEKFLKIFCVIWTLFCSIDWRDLYVYTIWGWKYNIFKIEQHKDRTLGKTVGNPRCYHRWKKQPSRFEEFIFFSHMSYLANLDHRKMHIRIRRF